MNTFLTNETYALLILIYHILTDVWIIKPARFPYMFYLLFGIIMLPYFIDGIWERLQRV